MDLPQPPADQELRNIIDKLAQFVARNGPEFEHMTKQKQKDNPKFSFLFGGTYFHYYQYKVTTEQAILKQKQRSLEQQAIVQQVINRQSIQTAPWQQHLQQIQDTSQEQIRQSEQNLAAQHQLLLQQQQVQVDEVIRKAQDEKINKMAKENDIDLKELDGILQPIIDSCTKDAISHGKGWIFSHATSPNRAELIITYILKKVTEPGATFETKLHLVYLINDVLHHCIRKNAEDLKKILEKAVVPIFCSTSIGVDAEKQQKLQKLHKLWETNKYFEPAILDQLQNPAASLAGYQAGLIAEFANLITPITAAIQAQYSMLQKQHQDFVAHLTGQLHQMQVQIPVPYAFQSTQAAMLTAAAAAQPAVVTSPYLHPAATTPDVAIQHNQTPEATKAVPDYTPPNPPAAESPKEETKEPEKPKEPEKSPPREEAPLKMEKRHLPEPEPLPSGRMMDRDYPPHDMCDYDMPMRHPNGRPMGPPNYMDDYSPHYGHGLSPYDHPDYMDIPPHMDMPPYGRGPRPFRDGPMGGHHDIPPDYMEPGLPPPSPPYYDLPAGLMVPLVRIDDTDYDNPLDPDDVHLPPPALPSERLLAAVEQFYCPPNLDRSNRNSYVISSEGWEQLGLYEFFKAKAQAKRAKRIAAGEETSRDQFELLEEAEAAQNASAEHPPEKKEEKKRRYREFKSPEPEDDSEPSSRNGSKASRRRSRSFSRSRSKSPDTSPRQSSRSPSPRPHYRSRRRSRSLSPGDRGHSPDRSQSPPFLGGGGSRSRESRLDESNKGHQLLRKMGWGGAGLGAAEQGIQDPVDAGEVRDRQDMYKGIGTNFNDPYENFRKSKGQAFINRMKARAEELGKV